MGKVIYIVQPLKPEHVLEISELATEYEIFRAWDKPLPPERLKDVEIILGGDGPFTKSVMAEPNHSLKWVQVHSAGIDYLDLASLENQDILLSNTSGIHGRPIAEHIIAVLLSKTRAIRESIYNQIEKRWYRNVNYDDLSGKEMLIMGAGRVGSEIAKLASAFDIKVTGINLVGEPIPYFDQVLLMENLDQVIGRADIIVNILPFTPATGHFFDDKVFSMMKDGVYFINSGRGPTVETSALIKAIENEKIGFAFLDVFEEEPLPSDSPLWSLKNTLVTAHIAGQVPHFKTKATAIYKENLTSYLSTGDIVRNKILYTNGF